LPFILKQMAEKDNFDSIIKTLATSCSITEIKRVKFLVKTSKQTILACIKGA